MLSIINTVVVWHYHCCTTCPGIKLLQYSFCWTYSHHRQIADKSPWKRWNGEFRGFRICVGSISTTGFGVVGFYVPDKYHSCVCVSFPATTPRATTPHRSFRLPQRGLPRPTALFPGYHARTYAIKLTGYHVCRFTTPELPRSKRTSGYRQVVRVVFSYFSFHGNTSVSPSTATFPPSLAHTARTHSTAIV